MDDIFISYTESDVAWATWIGEVTEAAERTCVLQEWDSLPGGNFVTWIDEQLLRARWVMPVYSPAYFDSKWCTTEWTSAMARSSLLPVMVERCVVPPVLSSITYADISAADERTARENLLYAIKVDTPPRKAKFGFPGRKSSPPTEPQDEKAVVDSRWARIAGALAVGVTVPEARTASIAIASATEEDDDDDDS